VILNKNNWLFLLLSCLLWFSSKAAFTGHIQLDSTWARVAYLALIPNLEESLTLNKDFILEAAPINAVGNYVFKAQFLPETQALYRVHFVKKGDPPATLILGGPNENHFFFIGKKNTPLAFTLSLSADAISDMTIAGEGPNQQIAEIVKWRKEFENLAEGGTSLKADLLNAAFDEKMRAIADTAQNLLVGLFAIHQGDFYRNRTENPELYFDFLNRWQGNSTAYFKDFALNFKPQKATIDYKAIAIGLILGFALALIFVLIAKRFKTFAKPVESNLQLLSVQEKKVYRLLQEGKTNKEISMEYSIGLSTVKTHVSSVLSKMQVKSRKELMV
jgi:DNA-binding CsgD family transcriptional regulator